MVALLLPRLHVRLKCEVQVPVLTRKSIFMNWDKALFLFLSSHFGSRKEFTEEFHDGNEVGSRFRNSRISNRLGMQVRGISDT